MTAIVALHAFSPQTHRSVYLSVCLSECPMRQGPVDSSEHPQPLVEGWNPMEAQLSLLDE